MIQSKVSKNTKLLILYDLPQHVTWENKGVVSVDGIGKMWTQATDLGVDFEYVSVACLSDNKDGKAAGFKEKEAYIDELVSTLAPNLILLPTAKAHEHITKLKGASKFYGKVLWNDKYNCKTITIPPYSMLMYNPEIQSTITSTLKLVRKEMEFPELIEKERPDKQYVMIDNITKFRSFFKHYKENVFSFSIDTETTSLQFNKGNIILIQFSHKDNFGACIPTPDYVDTWSKEDWEEVVAGMKYLIEDPRREKLVANGYFDFKFLQHRYGIKLPKENVFDILIASFLCDENRESHSLKFCAATLLEDAGDYERPLTEFVTEYCKTNKIKKADFTYDKVPKEILVVYSCMDVDYTFQLARYFKEQLKLEEQEKVMKDVSSYAWALARIEQNGWKIDLEEAARYKEELAGRIISLEEKLQSLNEVKAASKLLSAQKLVKDNEKRKTKLAYLKEPVEFLVSSPNHKRVLFRDILRFPEIKKTKKGFYGVDKECFTAWAEKYPHVPSIQVIKELEELSKMSSTYVSALLNRSVDGRIHCSYRVTGAATGRISSTAPNLQNITMHTEESKKLRKCFTVDAGNKLLCADLSNAELRIVAAISGDKVMSDGFKKGLDPHSNTAVSVFNLKCEVSEVKEKFNDYRQLAKTLGFACLYGAAPSLIAKKSNISNEEAAQHLEDYFTRHCGIKKLLDDNVKSAKELGYSVAASGRRRRVPHINSDDKYLVMRAERQAGNFLVQSLASDFVLQALVGMLTEIDELNLPYKIINVIHDSVELEVPTEYVPEASEFVQRHLNKWYLGVTADFPMKSDVEVGDTWADLKHFDADQWAEMMLELEEAEDEDDE